MVSYIGSMRCAGVLSWLTMTLLATHRTWHTALARFRPEYYPVLGAAEQGKICGKWQNCVLAPPVWSLPPPMFTFVAVLTRNRGGGAAAIVVTWQGAIAFFGRETPICYSGGPLFEVMPVPHVDPRSASRSISCSVPSSVHSAVHSFPNAVPRVPSSVPSVVPSVFPRVPSVVPSAVFCDS